eukprot:1472983-Amphidinium_carterae.3
MDQNIGWKRPRYVPPVPNFNVGSLQRSQAKPACAVVWKKSNWCRACAAIAGTTPARRRCWECRGTVTGYH